MYLSDEMDTENQASSPTRSGLKNLRFRRAVHRWQHHRANRIRQQHLEAERVVAANDVLDQLTVAEAHDVRLDHRHFDVCRCDAEKLSGVRSISVEHNHDALAVCGRENVCNLQSSVRECRTELRQDSQVS